jgi:hypothetical protein
MSKTFRIFLVALALFFLLNLAFSLFFRFIYARPVTIPPKAELTVIQQQAKDYLAAWQRGDDKAMRAAKSSKSLFQNEKIPKFSGEIISLTREYWRPAVPFARIMVGVFIRQGNDWKHWPADRMVFPVYEQGGKKYFLLYIKDSDQWKLLNGPGCDILRKPAADNNKSGEH